MQSQDSSLGAALREGFVLQVIAEEETSSMQCGITIQMFENTHKCNSYRFQILLSGATGSIISFNYLLYIGTLVPYMHAVFSVAPGSLPWEWIHKLVASKRHVAADKQLLKTKTTHCKLLPLFSSFFSLSPFSLLLFSSGYSHSATICAGNRPAKILTNV